VQIQCRFQRTVLMRHEAPNPIGTVETKSRHVASQPLFRGMSLTVNTHKAPRGKNTAEKSWIEEDKGQSYVVAPCSNLMGLNRFDRGVVAVECHPRLVCGLVKTDRKTTGNKVLGDLSAFVNSVWERNLAREAVAA